MSLKQAQKLLKNKANPVKQEDSDDVEDVDIVD